jgi:hypothetical protein
MIPDKAFLINEEMTTTAITGGTGWEYTVEML